MRQKAPTITYEQQLRWPIHTAWDGTKHLGRRPVFGRILLKTISQNGQRVVLIISRDASDLEGIHQLVTEVRGGGGG